MPDIPSLFTIPGTSTTIPLGNWFIKFRLGIFTAASMYSWSFIMASMIGITLS